MLMFFRKYFLLAGIIHIRWQNRFLFEINNCNAVAAFLLGAGGEAFADVGGFAVVAHHFFQGSGSVAVDYGYFWGFVDQGLADE